mgnify:FL=1|tara:strand:- start:153 stop:365 length:213 start_codon:yes stop_codon:yes gene_type:complete
MLNIKKYKVYTEEHRLFVNEVKAKSYKDAIKKVETNDNSFEDINNSVWETYSVEKIGKNNNVVKEWKIKK